MKPSYKTVNTFAEYKSRQLEMVRMIDWHQRQIGFHKAQQQAIKEQLEMLEQEHQGYQRTLTKQKQSQNKIDIQEVADMLAVDKEKVKDRILEKRTQELYKIMIGRFK